MKRLFILLALVIVFSCTSRYHKPDTTQDIEVKTQGWENNKVDSVKEMYQIKVISNKMVTGVGYFSVIEVNGQRYLVSERFIQSIK